MPEELYPDFENIMERADEINSVFEFGIEDLAQAMKIRKTLCFEGHHKIKVDPQGCERVVENKYSELQYNTRTLSKTTYKGEPTEFVISVKNLAPFFEEGNFSAQYSEEKI